MSEQFPNQPIGQISVEQLANYLADPPEGLQLVDVREPQEIAIANLAGFQNLPLSEFNTWSEDIQNRLNPDAETLVLCHHGVRSAQMCQWLISQGFTNVKNIVGGIDAYSIVVDRSVPQY
ncbi:rhodanese-related sulfurtransferase [Phormidium sp. LEGE 05292]|uniref:rhodanese-like domain-containing protein n=1 Tax=[Phormidium] sp. LEGE 05292 TaxID=767427 RepID=UPI00187EBB10|nr:rhodanese-like domain-containing protein [Phormidium sp. LEGE 05292]MBE9228136.1 rhodanese-related sulfurtransferase [Phormidium sp. LEGE 05292]